ncbi:hypothetical protein MHI57_24770 [Cytobacillus sp. FSL K6-0129]|uniref:hypothetical protein n=1 Tax=Cytobacillus sp. FSL K6-0129 TaxID=2921421 RepID=UPI0030F9D494
MKEYIVTKHAIQRAVERLGQTEQHAPHHLKQLMQTAFYQGETPGPNGFIRKFYDHFKTKTRLVVIGEKIITVYKFPEAVPIPFADEVAQVIKRKFAKSERDFKRKERALSIEIAEFNVELAQHRLSYAKAKSPKVRESLSDKISELETKVGRIQFELDEAIKAFNAIKEGAAKYL